MKIATVYFFFFQLILQIITVLFYRLFRMLSSFTTGRHS